MQDSEAWREKVARIIDPDAFAQRRNWLGEAEMWRNAVGPDHSQQTCDFMVQGKLDSAQAAIEPALAKADAIAALSAAPEGWPTEAMREAYYDCFSVSPGTESWAMSGAPSFDKVWAALLSAAPLPVIGGGKDSGADVAADKAPVSEGRPTPQQED